MVYRFYFRIINKPFKQTPWDTWIYFSWLVNILFIIINIKKAPIYNLIKEN